MAPWGPPQRLFDHVSEADGFGSSKNVFWHKNNGDFAPRGLCAAAAYVVNKHEGNYTNRNAGNPARTEGTANPLCI